VTGSAWIATAPRRRAHRELSRDVRTDVAVLGGGIAGVTTALLLAEAGLRVVLLEAGRIGHGVTGHTTAKVTSQHGAIYDGLCSRFGVEGARTYGAANEAALAWIADRVARDGIDCDFRRRDAYVYFDALTEAQREGDAARAAGLPAWVTDDVPLPYEVGAGVRFDDQAEFHAGRYMAGLHDALAASGCRIFEGSRAVEVVTDEDVLVRTPGGAVTAEQVVVATHYPFLDRSLAFARVRAERSYALLCRIAGLPPDAMLISAGSPTRSVRAVPLDGEELLLVSGEGHRTGTDGDTRERYRRLEAYAREHWDVRDIPYRWSAQDAMTADGVPYVGRVTPRERRVWMATGFAKWGMTGATAAALLLADLVQGCDNAWAPLFDPFRLAVRASAPRIVEDGAAFALHLVVGRLAKPGRRPIEGLAPGEGDIVRHRGEKVAAYRDQDGTLVAVSPVCTHMGCQVAFNAAERSWDCPCHGSRFAPDGSVLQGPAVHRLERRPV
jgi:glycine/D-amino acid oxidase-like deaminating enzyme/nitrite reductase/ring-hydroxylating ferredoxin subunit